MILNCLWCSKSEPEITFNKRAHTIPKSLGGQNYNKNICDDCNEYFGNRNAVNGDYSIEEALKETFNISRRILMVTGKTKRQVGRFKSKFFEVKKEKGRNILAVKTSFRFNTIFQLELCRAFKRGLYKMFLEEANRQNNVGFEAHYDIVRQFSRYNQGDLPVFYFNRLHGIVMTTGTEAETPILIFDRMKYLYSNDKFVEIEFLGHVFGFPISEFDKHDFRDYASKSIKEKQGFFKDMVLIKKLTDIDFTFSIFKN